jgi:hypothetical protein
MHSETYVFECVWAISNLICQDAFKVLRGRHCSVNPNQPVHLCRSVCPLARNNTENVKVRSVCRNPVLADFGNSCIHRVKD